MKTLTKKNAPEEKKTVWKSLVLFSFSTIVLCLNSVAQDVSNLKNSLAAIKAEQENQAFHEKMSYVYMFLGLAAVIAIAWFSTVYAKKQKKVVVETNHHRHYIKHPHDPRRRPKVNRMRRLKTQ